MGDKRKYDPITGQFDFSQKTPEGDDKERAVCNQCGFIHYVNPKVVVGSVVQWGNRILMCRREIEPRRGFWTLPAGYLEEHETTEEGAMREAQEEACADISITGLLAVYNIPRISQVQLMYTAELTSEDIAPGPESQEVALFSWDEIPRGQLAFPSVVWALNQFRQVQGRDHFPPFGTPEGPLEDLFGMKLPR
jgi:ADP-ribose pyrophosphatase YjhB (NUDIX family)